MHWCTYVLEVQHALVYVCVRDFSEIACTGVHMC